ncbi:MAG: twin-arginine translocase TatA/TatE family subunit [Bacteroidia bacterium]|nr:twin-arginine translocase TatA/TatE family subunit [Bacteroidia bacterium]
MTFISFFQPMFLLSLPGGGEWILIVLAIVLLFGAKKIPELARGLGKGIREFKDASKEIQDEISKESDEVTKSIK